MLLNHLRDEEEQNQPEEFPQGSARPIQKETYQYLPNFKVVIIAMTTEKPFIFHCVNDWVTQWILVTQWLPDDRPLLGHLWGAALQAESPTKLPSGYD